MRGYETSPLFDLVRLTAEGTLRPEARRKRKAAEARLQELEETGPTITRFAELLETHRLTFSNLDRYETALFRLLTTAIHELQSLRRAGEGVSAPAVLDVDVNVKGRGTGNSK